jgi:hypothetical protein
MHIKIVIENLQLVIDKIDPVQLRENLFHIHILNKLGVLKTTKSAPS